MGFSTSWNSSDSCQIYAMGNAQASLIENWLDICLFRCSTYFPNSEKNVTDVFPIKILSGKILWFLLKLWIFASRILENITEHGWANHVTKRIHTANVHCRDILNWLFDGAYTSICGLVSSNWLVALPPTSKIHHFFLGHSLEDANLT